MNLMPHKTIPIKKQKFDIGRVINLSKCTCKTCDFINCPKNNYCAIHILYKYKPREFFEFYKEDLLKRIKRFENGFKMVNWSNDLLNLFITQCIRFPKNRCFEVDTNYMKIDIYKFCKFKVPYKIMRIDYRNREYYGSYDYKEMYYDKDEKFAEKLIKSIIEIENIILNYKGEKNDISK